MMASLPPFYAENTMSVYNNILEYETTLEFPEIENEESQKIEPCMSKEAWRVVKSLICEPEKRFSSLKQFKNDPFFSEFDFDKIRSQEPPFVPQLDDETDTSYFSVFDDENVSISSVSSSSSHFNDQNNNSSLFSSNHSLHLSPNSLTDGSFHTHVLDPNKFPLFTWKKFDSPQNENNNDLN